MAFIYRYVDVNADAGGDGTTDALTGANCAYQSLSAWEAAEQGTIASGDKHIVYCNTGADSNVCAVLTANWTVTDVDGLQIRTNDTNNDYSGASGATKTAHHGGDPHGGYYIQFSANNVGLRVSEPNTGVYGISVDGTGGSSQGIYIEANDTNQWGDSLIARGQGGSTSFRALLTYKGKLYNCVAWHAGAKAGAAGFFATTNFNEGVYYNCTAFNYTHGFFDARTSGTGLTLLRNCVALACTNDYNTGGCTWGTGATCATSDASAAESWVTVTSVDLLEVLDPWNGELDLANPTAITTKLDVNGTDYTSTFTNSCEGSRTRTSTNFGIGAFFADFAAKFRLTPNADGTLDTSNTAHDAGTGTPYYTHLDNAVDGQSTDDVHNAHTVGTVYDWFALSSTPSDFSSMDSVTIRVDALSTAPAGSSPDTCDFSARVYDADNDTTTPLAGDSGSIVDEQSNTVRVVNSATMASPSGTKTAWDGAYIRCAWAYNKVAGPDNIELDIHGLVLDCTYTASAGGADELDFERGTGRGVMRGVGRGTD